MKKPKSVAKKNNKRKNTKQKKKIPAFASVILNITIGILFLVLINYLTESVTPYKWLSEKFLKGNLSFISKYPNIEEDAKLSNKLKMTYKYCHFINTYTPETSVILFPFDTNHFAQKDFKLKDYIQVKGRIMNKSFLSYFIYPREIVFLSEIQQDERSLEEITHLAIVDRHGYELLPGHKDTTQANTVLSVKRTKKTKK